MIYHSNFLKDNIKCNYSCNTCILLCGSVVKTKKPVKDPL